MEQVVVRKTSSGASLTTVKASDPTTGPAQALIQVHSISLNRGEVSRALHRSEDGWQPGWDFSGTVLRAAANGAGPAAGTRVVGLKTGGAWAQRVAVDVQNLAAVPDAISLETAATLPVAGLTALYALEKGGMGQLATQLALLGGASVTAAVYRNSLSAPPHVSADRFRIVRTDEAGLASLRDRRYDVIVESVGGDVFRAAVEALGFGGILLALGATRETAVSFDIRSFFNIGRAQIYGFMIFDELAGKPASAGLARLMALIEQGRLTVPVTYSGGIGDVDRVARDLLESKIPGKAVLSWPRMS